jgi:hypothetical protein
MGGQKGRENLTIKNKTRNRNKRTGKDRTPRQEASKG